MVSLEEKLNEAKNSRYRVIVTDGVFSMDGTYAKLPEIVELAERYEALIMVDDCHATGFVEVIRVRDQQNILDWRKN